MNSGDRLHDEYVIEDIINELDGTDFISGNVWDVDNDYNYIRIYETPETLSSYYLLESTLGHQCTFIKTVLLKQRSYDETLKIVADWEEMFYELVINSRTYKHINRVISDYPKGGIADRNSSLLSLERKMVRDKFFTQKEQDNICVQYLSQRNEDNSKIRLMQIAYTAFANQYYSQQEYKEIFSVCEADVLNCATWYQRFLVRMCLNGKMELALKIHHFIKG